MAKVRTHFGIMLPLEPVNGAVNGGDGDEWSPVERMAFRGMVLIIVAFIVEILTFGTFHGMGWVLA